MKWFNRGSDRREPSPDRLIRIFHSEAGEVEETRVPLHVRSTLLLLAAMFVVLVVATSLFQIDRVVTSDFGQIVTTEPTVVIEPLDLSIVRSIDVQEGDRVKAGQLLAELDPTVAAASVSSYELQLSSFDAEIARCEDELARKPYDYVPGNTPSAQLYATLQAANYAERKGQYDSQVHSYDEQVAQYRATIVRLRNDEKRYGDREKLNRELESIRTQLVAKKLDSRINLLAASDQKTEMLRNVEGDENTLIETQHQLAATAGTRDAFIQQWDAATSQELVKARNGRDAAKESLEQALVHLGVVRLTAPDDAIVLSLAKVSVGSVLQPSQFLMELALLKSPIEAEIYLDPLRVGFVRPGDDATLKLDPYHFVEHGWAEGKLRWVSQGTFLTPDQSTGGTSVPLGTTSQGTGASVSSSQSSATPLYKARITIIRADLKDVPSDFQLLPGMTLEADIHVGTRSLFWFLVRGLVRGFSESMREP
jgi:HlyD family secretion protein